MNHFAFTGPAFLLFYLIFSTLVIVTLVIARRTAESSKPPRLDLADPYLIAYLRGGASETLRVAVVSLVDRGLLLRHESQLRRAEHATPRSVRIPLESWLLRKFEITDSASSIYKDSSLLETCKVYEQTLKTAGLLPNKQIHRARTIRFALACLLLLGVGLTKIIVAIASGHSNIVFLVILMIIAIVVANKISFPRLTESGKAMIADLKELYSGMKKGALYAHPGGPTIEPMLLAAVFGLGALHSSNFDFTQVLFPRYTKDQSGASCAAGCGSCGSCGSSCGGGGCGGGCGGCGGS